MAFFSHIESWRNAVEASENPGSHSEAAHSSEAEAPRSVTAMATSPLVVDTILSNTTAFDVESVESTSAPRSQENEQSTELRQVDRPPDHLSWSSKPTAKVKVSALPVEIDTYGVWQNFAKYGNIDRIDIDFGRGSRQPCAYIVYKPPPTLHFWNNGEIVIQCKNRSWKAAAALVPWKYNTMYEAAGSKPSTFESLELKAKSLEFGILYTPNSMKAFHATTATDTVPIVFRMNVRNSRLDIEFPQSLHVHSKSNNGKESDVNEVHDWLYRFTIPFNANFKLLLLDEEQNSTSLIVAMDSPPEFSRKYAQQDSHQPGATKWDSTRDPWYRVVNLCERGNETADRPATLHDPMIKYKIGRWTAYRISFDTSSLETEIAKQFFTALENFNLKAQKIPDFEMITQHVPSVFELLDSHSAAEGDHEIGFDQSFGNDSRITLDFSVRYQLEVCISEGYLSEYRLDLSFLRKLLNMDVDQARGLLIGVAAQKQKIFDPMTIFDTVTTKPDRLQLPNYCFYARSVTVTPTTMYVATPSLDVSNRVIRRYREHTDRFVRVRFMEERPRGRISATMAENLNRVYLRIKNVLMNGIIIGNRHYQFLAFGNSQLREHTAYFFCSTGFTTPEDIRSWMGDFHDRVVAKYSARLGQCFSTTRAISGARITLDKLEDVKTADQRHIFTDGVGVISPFLAKIAANELGVLTADGNSPSAVQFRLGGCKGVLAVWPFPAKTKADIWIRRSQEKFRAEYHGLEIVRWSQFSSAYLNRQLITILTTLGVKDSVFIEKLDNQLAQLEEAMVNPLVASRALQRDIDPNQMSLEVAAMVNSHFLLAQEPFMLSILQLWRAYTIKYLKEKARILIHQGANLLGIIDEFGKLKGHFNNNQSRARNQHDINALPEIFVQLSNVDGIKGQNNPKVIEGVVLLARNPSLHPGDIRVVRAVNIPSLHHLRDVVVLPRTGDRDLASMCSGGDLDGDDYLVIWDPALIPVQWNYEPMDFTPPPPLEVGRPVTVDDITSFFVQYIKNDALGTIANAHLAWADISPNGAKNEKCLELASLHSTAVDYPKSGRPAKMEAHLRPRQFPHFMEKPRGSYHSYTALGKLYDRIQRIDFMPDYEKPFDKRVLNFCKADEKTLYKVAMIKAEYDEGIRRIMSQHGIRWELEVWSTFVLYQDGMSNGYKFHEEIGRLSSGLKDAIRKKCFEEAGGREYEKIAPFVAAMYKVTSLQVQNALEKIPERPVPSGAILPFISFPWIFSSIMGDIATGRIVETSPGTIMTVADDADSKSIHNQSVTGPRPSKKMSRLDESDTVVDIGTETTHKGEILELFDHSGADKDKVDHIEDLLIMDEIDSTEARGTHPQSFGVVPERTLIDLEESDIDEIVDGREEGQKVTIANTQFDNEEPMSLLDRLARMHST